MGTEANHRHHHRRHHQSVFAHHLEWKPDYYNTFNTAVHTFLIMPTHTHTHTHTPLSW